MELFPFAFSNFTFRIVFLFFPSDCHPVVLNLVYSAIGFAIMSSTRLGFEIWSSFRSSTQFLTLLAQDSQVYLLIFNRIREGENRNKKIALRQSSKCELMASFENSELSFIWVQTLVMRTDRKCTVTSFTKLSL